MLGAPERASVRAVKKRQAKRFTPFMLDHSNPVPAMWGVQVSTERQMDDGRGGHTAGRLAVAWSRAPFGKAWSSG